MSPGSEQLVLDLPYRAASGTEDFFVAPCNAAAVALIDSWPEWPAHAAVILGPPGSGKSHLGAVWQAMSGAAHWRNTVPEEAASVLVELDGRSDETALLHTFNWTREQGGSMLLLAQDAAMITSISLADLRSRLAALPKALLMLPDEAVLGAVIVKQFADRQVKLDQAVLSYILPRMERSFAAAQSFVTRADRIALARGRRITVPLAREVLQRLEGA